MDIRTAAQVIRDTVSMDDILTMYGYETKHGFMICPFHGDSDASLKVYKKTGGWHCFGCGKGGSVIDFVMEHEGCDFRTAVRAIDKAAGLGLMAAGDPYVEERWKRLQTALDRLEVTWQKAIDGHERYFDAWLQIDLKKMQEAEAVSVQERTAQQWTTIDQIRDEMLWLEWKKTECDRMREEVRAWRRAHRRPPGEVKSA